MKNRKYADHEIDEFIEAAQSMGIGPAIRDLGYPSMPTAYTWFKLRGVDIPTIDTLQARAAEMRYFYEDNEKKYAAQRNMEAIVEALETEKHDADGLNKLTNALHTVIKTFNLIEGKATVVQRTETKDATDLAINDLVEQMRLKNESIEESIA